MDNRDIKEIISNSVSVGKWDFDIRNMSQEDLDQYVSLAISSVINSSSFKSYIRSLVN